MLIIFQKKYDINVVELHHFLIYCFILKIFNATNLLRFGYIKDFFIKK